jgi:hypothetical protein
VAERQVAAVTGIDPPDLSPKRQHSVAGQGTHTQLYCKPTGASIPAASLNSRLDLGRGGLYLGDVTSLEASLRQYRLNGRALTVWLTLGGLLYLAVFVWLLINKPLFYGLALAAAPAALIVVTRPKLALLQFIVVLFIERAVKEGTPIYFMDITPRWNAALRLTYAPPVALPFAAGFTGISLYRGALIIPPVATAVPGGIPTVPGRFFAEFFLGIDCSRGGGARAFAGSLVTRQFIYVRIRLSHRGGGGSIRVQRRAVR